MKKLIVFGTDNYLNAAGSLINSAANYFDEFKFYQPKDIDKDFYENNKHILDQKRGAGYWLWKPYFIYKELVKANDGDIIFYVDAGNVFLTDPAPVYDILDKNSGIILFDNRDGMKNGQAAQNFISCKKDAFVIMGCDEPKYVNGTHLNASYQIYQKNNFSMNFVQDYLAWCQFVDVLTDTPNMYGDNYPGYYDHRHDQSVLSLLAIRHGIVPAIDPSEWGNKTDRYFPQIFNHHRKPGFTL